MRASCLAFCVRDAAKVDLSRKLKSLRRRDQKASHRKRLRRRGAVRGVAAPLRCAEASLSSRLLAYDPTALATPLHTLLQQPARGPSVTVFAGRRQAAIVAAGLL